MKAACVVSAVWVLLTAVPGRAAQAGLSGVASGEVLRLMGQVDITALLSESRDLLSAQCKEDFILYLANIFKEEWAAQMFDSSAKVPEAVLWGNMHSLGMFDECVDVAAPQITFTGQHCLWRISGKLLSPTDRPLISYRYATCVPSSCDSSELSLAVGSALIRAHIDNITVDLEYRDCHTRDSSGLKPGDWGVVSAICVVGTIAICSTIYDVIERLVNGNAQPQPVLTSFSLYSNLKSLMTVANGPMDSLHGLRALTMTWVVLCNGYMHNLLLAPHWNLRDATSMVKDAASMPIANGFLSADSFFFVSGLLVCFVFFRDMANKGSHDVLKAYIHRFIRLTPPLAVLVLLQVTVLMRAGDGPLWRQTASEHGRNCEVSWWSVLLYVQNYVYPNFPCLPQTWYLSADMQMFWISPLLLYPLYLWPVAGAAWLGVVTLGAVGMNFGLAYANELGPSVFLTTNIHQKRIDYVAMHMRMAPWLMGLAVGYVICGLKARKVQVRLPKAVVALGWLLTTAVCLSIIYAYKVFLDSGYNRLEAAFYLSLHRLGWGLGLAWIVFASVHGYGGPVNTFLSWSAFQPLSKLSYCTFLIHASVQIYRIGRLRVNQYFGDFEYVYFFLGDWVVATLLAIPFSLLFEMPFRNLDGVLFGDCSILPLPRGTVRSITKRQKKGKTEGGLVVTVAPETPDMHPSTPPLNSV